jgi:uncharacterized protein (TIGR03067 family)
MKLVLIPPGEFDMGSTPEEIAWAIEEGKKRNNMDVHIPNMPSEGPRHRVKITKPFYLGVFNVTQSEYEKVARMNPSACSPKPIDPTQFKPPLTEWEKKTREVGVNLGAGKDTSRYPVDSVSRDDAIQFCQRLSSLPAERVAGRAYRIPTEAEWEYACRAGTTTRWYCGDDEAGLMECAWYSATIHDRPKHPVGQKKPNAWGLYDMHGNGWQWCSDWFIADYYKQSPPNDPPGPAGNGSTVVMRGGHPGFPAEFCRSAYRAPCEYMARDFLIGFRVAVQVVSNDKLGTTPSPSGEASSEKSGSIRALQGKWRATRIWGGTNEVVDPAFWKEPKTLSVKDQNYLLVLADGTFRGTLEVDDATDPNRVTFRDANGLEFLLGLFQIQGDQLTACWAICVPGKPKPARPTDLEPARGRIKIVFQRVP